jgi:acetoacetyl-CoA synthetase
MSSIEDAHHVAFGCYADAWQWSIDNLDAFWRSIADMVAWRDEPRVMLERAVMPGARWCPGATLNYAANVVAAAPADAAVVATATPADRSSCQATTSAVRSRRPRPGSSPRASHPATASPPTSPTSPKRSWRSWPVQASA